MVVEGVVARELWRERGARGARWGAGEDAADFPHVA